MVIPLIFFIGSLLGIVTMLGAGLYKENTGKSYVLFSHGHKTDHVIKQKWNTLRRTLSLVNLHNAGIVFHAVLDRAESRLVKIKDWVEHRVLHVIDKAKARRKNIIPGKKQVSDFIADIKNHAENLKK